MKRAVLFLCVALSAAGATLGFPADEQIVNFHKVNASLYRGSQPNAAAIEWLRGEGVKSIINLRMANDVWPGEAEVATARGILYTNIPLNSLSAPTRDQMKTVLAAIALLPKPVFIHCQHGRDRTGTAVACYRIDRDGWSSQKALTEAEGYGLSPFELEMKQFIRHFKPL